jgi:hypothetical protein
MWALELNTNWYTYIQNNLEPLFFKFMALVLNADFEDYCKNRYSPSSTIDPFGF